MQAQCIVRWRDMHVDKVPNGNEASYAGTRHRMLASYGLLLTACCEINVSIYVSQCIRSCHGQE
jgi:hypothetical protein